MTSVHDSFRKRYGLLALAVALLAGGGAAMFMGGHNFVVRSIGSLACITSAYLVKKSNLRLWLHSSARTVKDVSPRKLNSGFKVMLAVGVVLLVAVGVSFHYLYRDALNGYHDIMPVYVFASVGLACTFVWAYLIAKMLA